MSLRRLRLRALLLLLALSLIAFLLVLRPPPVSAGPGDMNAAEERMFDALNGARDRRGLRAAEGPSATDGRLRRLRAGDDP